METASFPPAEMGPFASGRLKNKRNELMDTKPDTIKISVSHYEEIFASHANLYVTVKGSSVVSGDEAMKKAREVSQLVEALTGFGLGPEAIQLLGVHIESASGALLRSS